MVGRPGVGEVLARWMNDRDVNPTDLAKRAQISRATVYVVLDSRSKNPETMRQLAFGLAKRHEDDATGDPATERDAARDLLQAAGYGSLIVEYPSSAPETGSRVKVSPPPDHRAFDDEIAALLKQIPDASIALTDLARGADEWDDDDREFVLNRLRRLADRYGRSQAAC